MTWSTSYRYINTYVEAGRNQHGIRYKQAGSKKVQVARLEADYDDAIELRHLILLSHHLNVPVHYDFKEDPQVAWIEVVSAESLGA